VNIPQAIKIRIRRFLCRRCGKTTSVLPHWLLPRYQYTALLILSSLLAYCVKGKTAAVVTKEFPLSDAKHGWSTLRRWSAAFLVSASLWGWLGASLGVRKGDRWSRQVVRTRLQRFMTRFTDRVLSGTTPSIPVVVARASAARGLPGRTARGSTLLGRGDLSARIPPGSRSGPSTQDAGLTRAPP
jgi:hypothetical protein